MKVVRDYAYLTFKSALNLREKFPNNTVLNEYLASLVFTMGGLAS